jgi:hypothetical protein
MERNTKEEFYEQSEQLRLYLEASEDYLHPGLSCEAAALKAACEAAKRKHRWAKRQQESRIELEVMINPTLVADLPLKMWHDFDGKSGLNRPIVGHGILVSDERVFVPSDEGRSYIRIIAFKPATISSCLTPGHNSGKF